MGEQIKELLKDGKSTEDILEVCAKDFAAASDDEIVEALKKAEKALRIEKQLEESKKADEEAQAKDVAIKTEVKAQVEAVLKEIKVPSKLEAPVTVKENEKQWLEDAGEMIFLHSRKHLNDGQRTRFNELRQKSENKYKETYKDLTSSVISGTDANGGYFMPPEFDSELDKLTYSRSQLLEKIKIRQGGEKTEINSISTFDFTTRTNENTALTETAPTFSQQELKYRDAGAVVPISNRALAGSFYNITQELLELAADAKIRYIEPLIVEGDSSDPFTGLRFHAGVTTLNGVNNGGTGRIDNTDLVQAYLNSAAQSRNDASACFIMDKRELMVLVEEKASGSGERLNNVVMQNGRYIHVPTGKEIIEVNNLGRTNNGVTDNSSGSDVAVQFGALSRFRFYQLGGMRVDTSTEAFFKEDAFGIRFVFAYKFGIPAQSRSSFVSVLGITNNAV